MSEATSRYNGIEEARIGGQNVFFLDGVYEVEVLRCFDMKSRKKDDLFIVECKILSSTNPRRQAGTNASWVVNLKHEAALGNIKSFVAACNDIPTDDEERMKKEITAEVVEYCVSDDNPLEGTRVKLTATTIETRAKTPFTLHKFEALAKQAPPA